jgi:hypothetical protein
MPKHNDQTHADKPQSGAKGEVPGGMGAAGPGVVKGAGGDISGKHPPSYYEELDNSDREDSESEA